MDVFNNLLRKEPADAAWFLAQHEDRIANGDMEVYRHAFMQIMRREPEEDHIELELKRRNPKIRIKQ